jgi:uncharacterized protein YraI
MRHSRVLDAVVAALALAPVCSYAQWGGYAARSLNLRAGPATEYPLVVRVPAGVPISVQGCLSDYQWCDVIAGPNRGWVYANNLYYPYQGASVPVLTYGAVIGIGIVAFAVGSYWDAYYRGHPWYQQRQYWVDRPHRGFGPGGYGPSDRPQAGPSDHRTGSGFVSSGHHAQEHRAGGDHSQMQGPSFGSSHHASQERTASGSGHSQGHGSGDGHHSAQDHGH